MGRLFWRRVGTQKLLSLWRSFDGCFPERTHRKIIGLYRFNIIPELFLLAPIQEKMTNLKKHCDRESAEIAVTICLGYDISNLKDKSYKWPLWIKPFECKPPKPIILNQGDIMIYRGSEIEHWRNRFEGVKMAQLFLHFNDANGPMKDKPDVR